ncbi:MAG: 16S rRNA (guanine(527)-N(7))-methyltransferase RsmG [Anaerobutyricum sp.]|nr:16S rRNA (guanine(527)-N(7))-methyltransferase RsmG [Anaerobutyricum sp.]
MDFKQKLRERALKEEIVFSEKQLEQFQLFYEMLIKRNKSMNLTAITEENEVIEKHFIDSLSCRRVIDMSRIKNCIDVGTGGGFPGIPLKIMYPDVQFVLIDSLKKRTDFLQEVKEKLNLDGLEILHGRAEDLAREKTLRAVFDLCVSRAVANLSVLSEYCIPFVKTNGYFISYKGKKGYEEMKESENCMKILGCKIEKVEEFSLGEEEAERLLVKIKKCKGTPKVYPRKAGTPSRNPL